MRSQSRAAGPLSRAKPQRRGQRRGDSRSRNSSLTASARSPGRLDAPLESFGDLVIRHPVALQAVKTLAPGLVLRPRALISRLKSDPILRNSAIYLTGSVLTGILGYVFHFETGHLLGPSSYAVVASAIAALYVLTLPVVGLQLVSARYASMASARNQRHAILRS